MLGRDATLPQYRSNTAVDTEERPRSEYLALYAFYGTLANLESLAKRFDVDVAWVPPLQCAVCLDGRVRTWAGKYRALVDAPGCGVEGDVFVVQSLEQKLELMRYEGDSYEVVRARVIVNDGGCSGREIEARTFLYASYDDELEQE